MILHKLILLVLLTLNNTLTSTYAYTCTINVSSPDGHGGFEPIPTFLDCSPIFEICCDEGCCPRFSHAHIWMFAAAFSFIIFICIFGCWLFCCKNKVRRNRTAQRPPQPEELVDSPLTLVVPENRNDIIRVVNQNSNPVPVTPPPTYEEATAMR